MTTEPELCGHRRRHDGPAWRMRFAEEQVRRPARRLLQAADEPVRAALAYLRASADGPEGRERAAREQPTVATAVRLEADAVACQSMKILTLGACPRTEIAARLGVAEEIVATWEALFFDVRACREATDWILTWVIRPEHERGNAAMAARLKFACNGPVAARATLDAAARIHLAEGERRFAQKILLALKFDEAMQAILDSDRNKLAFIKLYSDLLLREKCLRLEERKLEQRCQESLAHQHLMEKKLALSERRDQHRQGRTRRPSGPSSDPAVDDARAARAALEWAARQRAADSPLARLTWATTASPAARPGTATPAAPASARSPALPEWMLVEAAESWSETRVPVRERLPA